MEKGKTNQPSHGRQIAQFNFVVFVFVLSAGGVFSFLLPKEKISESEKRELAPFPTFSLASLFDGDYTDSLDLYYADNFPLRNDFVELTGLIKESFGYRANDIRIYTTEAEPAVTAEGPAVDSAALVKADTLIDIKKLDSIKHTRDFGSSIMIYDGMAFQMFGGSETRAINFAGMINDYRKVLHDSIKIYSLIAPTPIDFYLPMHLKGSRSLEKPNIRVSYEHLDSGVIAVDAYSEIEAHASEYLYFHTDHHWTGLGGYYAYRALCMSAGMVPAELSAFQRRVRKGYLGSLYDLTKDISLKKNRDSVETFRLPMETVTYRYANSDLKSPVKANLFAATGNYATFLGGDFPLVRIESENRNGRVVLVIKDSFGNAVCPYLAMNFQEVIVVDYRYFERNILDFIRKHRVTDLVFLHNTFVVNSEFTVRKERYLMRIKDPVELKVEVDTVKKQLPDTLVIEKSDSLKN